MLRSLSFKYDAQTISCTISQDNLLGILTPSKARPLENLSKALSKALQNPIGGPTFSEFIKENNQVTLVVSDITRYTGAEHFLPLILNKINECGIPDKNIAILFALGIHRHMAREEQEKVVGKEVAQRITLDNHDARDPEQLVSLGVTSRGTPVAINKRAGEASKLILTGTIGFHYLAGFGGGRKSVIPGIASYETCVANHLLTLDPAGKGRHPHARTAVLDGNPMHDDMMEACAQLPPTFIVNTILSPEKEIVHLVAGDLQKAFYQGCDFVRQHFARTLSEPADLVIVSCGGYPKDINFIQSHKTIDYAMNALKPGGVMIALAACRDGIGNEDFSKWIQYPHFEEMVPALRKDFQINGQTAYATLLKARQAHILLMSELPDNVVKTMSMTPVHSMDEALKKAYEVLGTGKPLTYVVPYGSVTLPIVV